MPRQMPSTGRSRSAAPAHTRSSCVTTPISGGAVRAMRGRAWRMVPKACGPGRGRATGPPGRRGCGRPPDRQGSAEASIGSSPHSRSSQEPPRFRDDSGLMSESPEAHRVLVVDDEPNIADVVTMALRFQGCEVETAGTGAEAISAVSDFKPQLIVLDVMLPDMEGFDVAKRLGAQRARVPIIYLTARDATEDKIRGLTLGGDDYVTKPFSLEELIARVRSVLRRSGLADPDSSRLVFEDLGLDEDAHEV